MYKELRKKLAKTAKGLRSPSEGTTISTLVLPALYALGWDNPPEAWVEMHQKAVSRKEPDIALVIGDSKRVGVEVKQLANDLERREDMSQAVGYAADLKVRWMILTDGFRWDLFDCKDLTEKDAEELRILSATLDDSTWERLADALQPSQVFSDSLAVFSAESTLIPIAQERWANLKEELPTKLIELVLPSKEFSSYTLPLRRKAMKAVIGATLESEIQVEKPKKDITITLSPPEKTPTSDRIECNYFLLPVMRKNEHGEFGREVIIAWLTQGYWGLNRGTAYRQHFKKGDKVCMYASGEGVVATATIAGKSRERKPRGLSRNSDFYLPLESVDLFEPRPLTSEIRTGLDIMKNKSTSAQKHWVWLVQGTTKLTEKDYLRITGAKSAKQNYK